MQNNQPSVRDNGISKTPFKNSSTDENSENNKSMIPRSIVDVDADVVSRTQFISPLQIENLKIPDCNLSYVSYSEAIKAVISDIYKTNIQTFLTEDQYRGLLNSVFQEELEKVPCNLEKYLVLYSVRIRLYCEICAVKISYFNCTESSMKEVVKHIKGKNHTKNVAAFSFDLTVSNFDLDDAFSLPYDMFSQLPADLMEEKKYFKACLYLLFKCKVCNRKFSGYNKMIPVRKAIYNHINDWEHVSKYIKMFPQLEHDVGTSKDVILSSIDSIYEQTKTFVSKELYLDVLYKIYQDKLKKFPEHTEKCILIRLGMSLNCNVCKRILTNNYKDLENQVSSHIVGRKHYKQCKPFLQPNGDISIIDKYSESVVDDDMIKVPDNVLIELLCFLKRNDYKNKVKNFFIGHFVFNVRCVICDQMVVITHKLSCVRQVIYGHINNKVHVSAVLRQILI